MLCSVVRHLGSVEHSRSREKHSTTSHFSSYVIKEPYLILITPESEND